jgi:hypothetical protein
MHASLVVASPGGEIPLNANRCDSRLNVPQKDLGSFASEFMLFVSGTSSGCVPDKSTGTRRPVPTRLPRHTRRYPSLKLSNSKKLSPVIGHRRGLWKEPASESNSWWDNNHKHKISRRCFSLNSARREQEFPGSVSKLPSRTQRVKSRWLRNSKQPRLHSFPPSLMLCRRDHRTMGHMGTPDRGTFQAGG